jgi:hypothetical protein
MTITLNELSSEETIPSGNSIQRNPTLTSFIRPLSIFRVRQFSELFWPIFHFFSGDNINNRILPAEKKMKNRLKRIRKLTEPEFRKRSIAKGLLPYRFIDDREACLFISCVERPQINAPLSELEKNLLQKINDNPLISYEILTTTLKKDRSTIRRAMQKLKSLGLLRRIGSDKKGYWEILPREIL